MLKMNRLLTILILLSTSLFSQNNNRILLQDYLSVLQEKHNIVFSYNSALIANIKIKTITGENLSNVLDSLNNHSAFTFKLIDTNNVIVSSKQGESNFFVSGIVLDKDGTSLPGATIGLTKKSTCSISNEKGHFSFLCNYNSNDSLIIRFLGYKSQKIALSKINDYGLTTFILDESPILLSAVKIIPYTTAGVLYNTKYQSIEIRPGYAGLLPGETETDIFNSLQYLPGINSPTGKAGNLTIRGTDPDKTLITFDNIPIYHLGHYLGTFSPYNSQMIDVVKIQRNGSHGSEKGGRVGGLVEIKSKSDILDSAKYSMGIATSYISGDVQIPIIKNKLGLLVGGRGSYPYNWNSPKIKSINEFIYQESSIGGSFNGVEDFNLIDYKFYFNDFNTKLVYQPNEKHHINLSVLMIDNKLNYNTYFYPQSLDIKDSVELNNWGGSFSVTSKWSSKISTSISFTNSYYKQYLSGTNRNDDNDIDNRTSYSNETKDIIFKNNLNIKLKNINSLDIGYQIDNYHVSYNYVSYTGGKTISPSLGPPITITESSSQISKSENSTLHTGYLSYNFVTLDQSWTMIAGVRTSYYTLTNKTYPEPRLIVNFFPSKHITIKGNLGVYNQFINHVVGVRVSPIGGVDAPFWQLSNNDEIKVVSGKQFMLGSMYSKHGILVDIEGYFKLIDNVTAYNFIDNDTNKTYVYGNYENVGVDILIKKSYNNFEGWCSYSFSSSDATFDTLKFPNLWNQAHIFSMVFGYTWKSLKFSIGWNYKTGLAVAEGIRNQYLVGKPIRPGSNTTPPPPNGKGITLVDESPDEYVDFFPDSHQLDLSITYKIVPKSTKWNLIFGGGIQNIYDYRVAYSQGIRSLGPGSGIRFHKYTLGFTPNFLIRLNW